MNNKNTPKPHPHAELIKAWADGAKIQYWHENRHEWIDKGDPCWYEWCEYRVKPEEPSNEPWKPKKGEKYYYLMISYDGFELYSTTCGEYNGDNIGIDEMGNCFRTREEAEAAANRVVAALKGELKISAPNDEKIQLDGKQLTDGEKALIRAIRGVEIYHVFNWNESVICTADYRPVIGGLGVSVSHRAVAMLPSIATSADKEKAIIAALKQIQAEQEESNG